MSEDTGERMERASRIRQMREGQRASLEATDDDGDVDGQDDGGPSSEADNSPSSDGSTEARGGQASTAEREDRPSSESDAQPAVTDDASADSRVEETGESTSGDTAGESATESDADRGSEQDEREADGIADEEAAAAVAQRAAEAAMRMTGDSTDGTASTPGAGIEAMADVESAADASTDGVSDAPVQGPTGVGLPDQASLEAAVAEADSESDSGTAGPARRRDVDARNAATAEDTVRVLEFTLGDEHYCLDISHVEEIVKREAITRVPNTPEYVEGVVDLRGQITTILDPKLLLDIDREGPESLLVVFSPDEFEDLGAIGWVVDEVRQVAPIVKSEVSAAPVDADYIEGVIDRDDEDEFVIWTDPGVAIELAAGEQTED